MQPFLKMEADTLLAAGYQDMGWREVSSEAFGVPNPKRHVILVATAKQCGLVDSCLFSTVGHVVFAVELYNSCRRRY
jgi:site-specific DNA-cytosine methylase